MDRKNKLRIEFETHSTTKEIKKIRNVNLDSVFVLLREPFIGQFRFYDDDGDFMPIGTRSMYPFAYAGWLIENYNIYMNESIEKKDNQKMQTHVFAYPLGDASPEILLYREGQQETIKPLIVDRNSRKVDIIEFSKLVRRVCEEALEILYKNPTFRKSKRLSLLKERMAEHYLR